MDTLDFQDFHQYLLQQNCKIIHEIWFDLVSSKRKSQQRYDSLKKYRDSWLIKNPNWLFVTWNYKRTREFIKTLFPQHLAMFDSYPYAIQRIDMSRYFMLYTYGGLYKDTDYICMKPWDEVIQRFPMDVYLVETPNKVDSEHVHVSNSLMFARVKNHQFWSHVFIELEKCKDQPSYLSRHMQIMMSTGPIVLNHVYHTTRMRCRVGYYPYRQFHPYGLLERSEDSDNNKVIVYASHMGNGSWESGDSKILIFLYQEYKILLFLAMVMLIPYFMGKKYVKK